MLLAKNTAGYFDLVKITSEICLSDKKAIPLSHLAMHQEHLLLFQLVKKELLNVLF
ncbi:hypothetical protein SD457_04095 [Coprobacillaceae bacterium CR2/5/TPMF4]|nr:hypothetical protein SD457_04095 [Coprobacillaceae bacterium CR2/5/TPMF4]